MFFVASLKSPLLFNSWIHPHLWPLLLFRIRLAYFCPEAVSSDGTFPQPIVVKLKGNFLPLISLHCNSSFFSLPMAPPQFPHDSPTLPRQHGIIVNLLWNLLSLLCQFSGFFCFICSRYAQKVRQDFHCIFHCKGRSWIWASTSSLWKKPAIWWCFVMFHQILRLSLPQNCPLEIREMCNSSKMFQSPELDSLKRHYQFFWKIGSNFPFCCKNDITEAEGEPSLFLTPPSSLRLVLAFNSENGAKLFIFSSLWGI